MSAGTSFEKRLRELFSHADIRIGGERPWDMQVHKNVVHPLKFSHGSLGMGESYMDGHWNCEQLDEFFCRLTRLDLGANMRLADIAPGLRACLSYPSRSGKHVDEGERHYEFGSEPFAWMLDRRMIYSCAHWQDANTLDEAQERKLDLIAHKLKFEPGMKILDIGCGWGGAIHYFAERYGVTGVAVTISKDQFEAATRLCEDVPVEIRLQDYRDINEQFECSYSIDMLGHVGRKSYRKYMELVYRTLVPGGRHLVQTAGSRLGQEIYISWRLHSFVQTDCDCC